MRGRNRSLPLLRRAPGFMVESRVTDPMPISQLPRGTLIVDYRVEAVLGRGGMSVVYLVEDLRLKRHVALKLLTPTLAEDARFRERFLSESELAASLDHANVIPIYEAGEADGHLYIAMRYVEGSDLKARLGDGPLSAEETVAIAQQIGGALDAAHERGLVHGDVKPSNVLIDGHGHVYLADFGLTKRLGDERLTAGDDQLMGTIDYVAPEQIRGEPVDGRADIHSLGCLLYECLTGRQPFKRGNDAAVLYAHLEDEAPATGTAADPVIAKALAKEPDQRYQTGAELTEAVRDALGVEGERRGRWLPALVLVSLLAVAVAVAALVMLRNGGPAAVPHGELVRIDPESNRVAGSVSVGADPTGVAADPSSIWVTTLADGNAWRVDPAYLRTSSVPTDGSPIGVAAHGGSAFVVDSVSGAYGGGSGGLGLVTEISDQDGRAIHSIRTGTGLAIADGPAGLWVTRQADVARLALVSPVVGAVGQKIPIRSNWSMTGLAVGAGGVWGCRTRWDALSGVSIPRARRSARRFICRSSPRLLPQVRTPSGSRRSSTTRSSASIPDPVESSPQSRSAGSHSPWRPVPVRSGWRTPSTGPCPGSTRRPTASRRRSM